MADITVNLNRQRLKIRSRPLYITVGSNGFICSGPRDGNISTSSATAGSAAGWSDVNFVKSNDGLYSYVTLNSVTNTSQQLKLTDFGFNISSLSVIKGITVEILCRGDTSIADRDIRIIKNGVVSGDDMADAALWPTTFGYKIYGSSNSLWGLTWTSSDFNADFGIAIQVQRGQVGTQIAQIDHIKITVCYDEKVLVGSHRLKTQTKSATTIFDKVISFNRNRLKTLIKQATHVPQPPVEQAIGRQKLKFRNKSLSVVSDQVLLVLKQRLKFINKTTGFGTSAQLGRQRLKTTPKVLVPTHVLGPTRLYFSESAPATVAPSYDSAWEYTSETERRKLNHTKDTSAIAIGTRIGPFTSAQDALDRQYVSYRMASGVAFDTSWIINGQIQACEYEATDDVVYYKTGIRIVSEDGATVRATLLPVNNYGSTTELSVFPTLRNKTFIDGDPLQTTYTTVRGDRLAIELGYTAVGAINTSFGPNSPLTAVDDPSIGTEIWSNVNNIFSSNDSYATTTISGTNPQSHYLKATNFGFSIPAGAIINGIIVEWEKKGTSGATVRDNAIRIVKSDTIGSTDKSSVSDWPLSDTYISYGSSSDLWGETWTAADINSSTFGAALSVKWISGPVPVASIDHVRITVYYNTGSTTIEASTRWGENGTDLLVNETETSSTFNPWIEFSQHITFIADDVNETVFLGRQRVKSTTKQLSFVIDSTTQNLNRLRLKIQSKTISVFTPVHLGRQRLKPTIKSTTQFFDYTQSIPKRTLSVKSKQLSASGHFTQIFGRQRVKLTPKQLTAIGVSGVNNNIPLFIGGSTNNQITNNLPLYINGFTSSGGSSGIFDSLDLFVEGRIATASGGGPDQLLPLFIKGTEGPASGILPLFIGGPTGGSTTTSLPLVMWADWPTASLKLYVKGKGLTDRSPDGAVSASGSIPLVMWRIESVEANIPLFMKVAETTSGLMPLYVQGGNNITSGLILYTAGYSSGNANIVLFTKGF